jgi:hypothetical protein
VRPCAGSGWIRLEERKVTGCLGIFSKMHAASWFLRQDRSQITS